MTRTTAAWDHSQPWMHVLGTDSPARVADLLPPTGLCATARFDGRDLADTYSLFERFVAQLRFPVYFGWNWSAFSECMRDMSWMPANRYLVIIENASGILTGEPDELGTFLRIMRDIGESWSRRVGLPETASGKQIAFNTVLLESTENLAAVAAHLDRATVRYGT